MNDELFAELHSLTDVEAFLREAAHDAQESTRWADPNERGADLPLALAEPGPLMVKAVELAGPDGMTRAALLELFEPVGADRTQRGIDQMRASQRVLTCRVSRSDGVGPRQRLTVYRAIMPRGDD
jgi:hypothetical protein